VKVRHLAASLGTTPSAIENLIAKRKTRSLRSAGGTAAGANPGATNPDFSASLGADGGDVLLIRAGRSLIIRDHGADSSSQISTLPSRNVAGISCLGAGL
jgi:hypothetical protein